MRILRRTADGKAKMVGQGFNIMVPQDMADYVVYYDSADATDHSHAKPGVATPTDYGWYRVYKSGWVEQGGVLPTTPSATGTADLIIPLVSAPVCVHLISVDNTGTPWQAAQCNIEYNYSASSGTTIAFNSNDGRSTMLWDVAGQS